MRVCLFLLQRGQSDQKVCAFLFYRPVRPFASSVRENGTRFWPNSGSRFPDGVGCGKCDPDYCSKTGCSFPDAPQTESASHSGAPKRDTLSLRKNCRSHVERYCSLLAQDQRRELCLGVHHVVGAGGLQLCTAAETPADARALKAGVVTGQNIDIGIAHIERGRRIGA